MANKKTPTIKEQFAEIMEQYPLSPAHRKFFEERIAVLDRKTTERKPTAHQLQNAEIAEQVYAFMANEPNRLFTCGELLKVCPALANCETPSASYANAIIKRLKDAGRVLRTESKGRAYFQAVVGEGV